MFVGHTILLFYLTFALILSPFYLNKVIQDHKDPHGSYVDIFQKCPKWYFNQYDMIIRQNCV